MKDLELKDKFVELRATGKSFASISAELGVSKSTLIDWSKDLTIEIKNLRQIHLESIREKYRFGVEKRIELFGQQLQNIQTELSKRDLSQIPIERLFNFLLKFGSELNTDDFSLTFCQRKSGFDFEPINSVSDWQA